MDTKKLRQKILDLAIRGKLVPQDPNDEPASVLLERIRAEKEQLIKEGKIKRSKKSVASDTSHYENVPFEVPESWCWTTIEAICSKIGSGSTPRGSNYSPSGIPFFRSQNVYDDGLCFDDIKFISRDIHQSMIGTEVLPNDVLLNITGGSLGRCAVVPPIFNVGNVSQHVCILRPVLILPKYLHAFLLSGYFHKSMEVTGSGREGLPKYSIEKMLFPLPPIDEQKRIIDKIGNMMLAIDIFKSASEELELTISRLKEKILELAISGKLIRQNPADEPAIELLKRITPGDKPTDNRHYRNVPKGWAVCTFGDILEYEQPQQYIVNSTDYSDEYEIPVLTAGKSFIIGKTNEKSGICKHLPVIIFDDFTTDSKYVDFPFKVKSSAMKILHAKGNVNPKYVAYLMSVTRLVGDTHKRYWISEYSKIPIMLPPVNEQERIVSLIEKIYDRLDKILAEL